MPRRPTAIPTERTVRAIERYAELFWQSVNIDTIASTLRAEGLCNRQPDSLREMRHAYPSVWVEACRKFGAVAVAEVERNATMTLHGTLGWRSRYMNDPKLPGVLDEILTTGDAASERAERYVRAAAALASADANCMRVRKDAANTLLYNLNRRRNKFGGDLDEPEQSEAEARAELKRAILEDPELAAEVLAELKNVVRLPAAKSRKRKTPKRKAVN